ncbi:cation-transporting atpase 4 protein [Rutstroemia sp. NJR-2017a BVV2]|nr:cation-transporting atpase 4 protein [Rutstroemia sp. NJR-2017a BVV2]
MQPKDGGATLLWVGALMLGISWPTVILRVIVRSWKRNFGKDDMWMVIGLVLFTVCASMCMVTCFYGSGQLSKDIPTADRLTGTKIYFVLEFFYASSASAIKCSIALTLHRIADTRRNFVWAIWIIVALCLAAAFIFCVVVLNICHPIDTLWSEHPTGTCNMKLDSDISFFFSVVEIITDFALAIMPAILLWNVQMKFRVKVSVILMLGMAAFASCATIVRLRFLSNYSNPNEFMYAGADIATWSLIEEGVGICAGSLSALRPLLSIFGSSNGPSDSSTVSASNRFAGSKRADINLDTFHQIVDSVVRDVDAESQKQILKETEVTVTSNNRTTSPAEWHENQVLGWQNKSFEP